MKISGVIESKTLLNPKCLDSFYLISLKDPEKFNIGSSMADTFEPQRDSDFNKLRL